MRVVRSLRLVLACALVAGPITPAALRAQEDLPDGEEEGEVEDAPPDAAAPSEAPAASDEGAPPLGPPDEGSFEPPPVVDEAIVPRAPRIFREVSFRLPRVPLTAVATHPSDAQIFVTGADGFVFKSDDGGESWRPVLTFARGLADDVFLQDQRDNRRFNDPLNNELPTRDDGNASEEAALGDVSEDASELLEDDDDTSDNESLEDVDSDDGERRQRSNEGSVANDDDLLPDGDVDVVTMQGLLAPERPGVRALVFAAGGRTLYVATPRGLFRSVDVGETFAQIELPGGEGARDIRAIAVDPADPQTLFVGTREGTYVTTDDASSFLPVVGARREPVLTISAERFDGALVVHIGDAIGVMRSWDGGSSFLPLLLQGMSAFEPVSQLAFDARHGTLYAGTPTGLFVAERKAAILERRLDLFGVPVTALSVDPLRRRGVAIGLDGGGLVASDDTGLTLIDLGDNVPALTALGIARIAAEPDALLVATERGLFLFDEGTGILVDEDRLRVLEDAWRREPTLRETVEAALDYAQIHPRHFRPLATRARLSALAPRIQLQYRFNLGRRTDSTDRYVVLDEDEPDEFDADDEKDYIDLYDQGLADFAPQRGNFHSIFATFSWRLDRLIFNADEPRVLRISPNRQRAEARVADQAQVLFVARRRLHAQIVLDGADRSIASRAAAVVRLQELDALLDGMTGGRFIGLAAERGGALDPVDPFKGAWREDLRPRRPTARFAFVDEEQRPLQLALTLDGAPRAEEAR